MENSSRTIDRICQTVLYGLSAFIALWIAQIVLPVYPLFNRLIYKGAGIPVVGPWFYFLFSSALAAVETGIKYYGSRRFRSLHGGLAGYSAGTAAAVVIIWIVFSLAGEVVSYNFLAASGLMYVIIRFIPRWWYDRVKEGKAGPTSLVEGMLVPAVLMAVYSAVFARMTGMYLPSGVNRVFSFILSVSMLGAVAVLLLAAAQHALWGMNPFRLETRDRGSGLKAGILLLLVPAAPVVQYILANRNILPVVDIVIILGVILLAGLILGYGIPAVLQRVMSARVAAAVGLSYLLTLINMSSLSRIFAWFERGNIWIQLLVLAAGYGLLWMFSGLKRTRELGLVVGVFFLFGSGVIQILFGGVGQTALGEEKAGTASNHPLIELVEKRTPDRTPNVYFLVYESYAPGETMAAYGIDNSEQEAYLGGLGFVHYPQAYSIGADTIRSMSRVLSVSDRFSEASRQAVSGDGVVQNALSTLGYVTHGIFQTDYMFRENVPGYDVYYPEGKTVEPYAYLLSAIAVGEFRFNLEDHLAFAKISSEEFSQRKLEVSGSPGGEMSFIYIHTPRPGHSQNSGTCRLEEVRSYEERLKVANEEMKQDVSLLVENDPGAIIIVAGDHGPYLTKNCTATSTGGYPLDEITRLDIQDRYGVFLAVRWPEGEQFDAYEISLLQNLFPAVFLYMYGDVPAGLFIEESGLADPELMVSGADVVDGIIQGGVNDREPLFLQAGE